MNLSEKVIQEVRSPYNNCQLRHVPHSFSFYPNLTTTYSTNNITNDEKIYCSNPIPLLLSKSKTFPPDILLKPVIEKGKWISDINHFKARYKKSRKIIKLNDYKEIIERNKIIPKYLADFCSLLDADPDTYFDGNYNWYHTNGSLRVEDYENEKILFHATGSMQNNLSVSKLIYDKETNIVDLSCICSKNTEDTIFETQTRNIGNQLYIYNRYKSKFTINNLDFCDGKYNLKRIYERKFSVPLSSAFINVYNPNNYCSVDVNKEVNIWDINTNQNILSLSLIDTTTIDKWSSLLYTDLSQLLCIDRQNIFLIDIRENQRNQSKFTLLNNLLPSCDYNSFVTPSLIEQNQFFIGTYHSLVLIDLRNNKNVVKKWTHMMNSIPFMGHCINSNNLELLCLASSLPNEKILFTNNGYSAPLMLNSLYDTRKKLQLKGNCLHPKCSINKRINYCTTGLVITNINNISYVLTQNALGDVYVQKFSFSKFIGDDFIKHNMREEFERKITNSKILNVTHERNMKHLLTKNRSKLKTQETETRRRKRKRNQENWRKSVRELNEYKDLLSQVMLSAWEFDDGQVNDADKVTSWLMTIDPDGESVSDQTQQNQSQSENIFNTQETTSTPKSTKVVKRQYISGF